MEKKLTTVLAATTIVLAVTTATLLVMFVGPSLLNRALAQGGSGLGFFQMPCATRYTAQTGSAFTPTGIVVTGDRAKDAEAAGLAFYARKYGDKDVTVKATDYGCHIQTDVVKNGSVVTSLVYDGAGGIFELE